MEVLAIIPVRGGSKGIPGKNIKPLAGKPLVFHTIEAAKNSKYITRTIVSTECSKIKEVLGGGVFVLERDFEVLDRPEELAQDVTKTAPVMLHVVEELEKTGYKPDVVVLLQATCPLRDAKELDAAFELYLEKSKEGCDSVFAAMPAGITHALWRQDPDDGHFEGLYDYRNRPRRQDEDRHFPMVRETGATYIVRADVFKEVKDFIGKRPAVYLDGSHIDIDTHEDFERAAEILKERNPEEDKDK